jgi:hypothetical protein
MIRQQARCPLTYESVGLILPRPHVFVGSYEHAHARRQGGGGMGGGAGPMIRDSSHAGRERLVLDTL